MRNLRRPRSRPRGVAVPAAIPIAVATLLACGCAMPPQMKIENANDPRYEDLDARFRTTYYFRVYDPCPPTAAAGAPKPPASDTLYRFRMTGKAKSLTNQVHFEAGTLQATQIDPLGATVAYDERNRQFYFKSQADSQEDAQRERRLAEIERLVELYRGYAGQAAAPVASAASAGMGVFRDELQNSIVARIVALDPRAGHTGGDATKLGATSASGATAGTGASPVATSATPLGCAGARGFQILGPEGWRIFRQDERLLMAMSSSGKPLIGTMQEIAGRVLNDQPIEAEILLPLVREELRLTRAERVLDRYDQSKPQTGAEALQGVIDALRKEAK